MTLKGRTRGVNFFQADLLNNVRTVWSRTTKFGKITNLREGRIFRSATLPPQEGGPQCSTMLGYPVPFYFCVHPLTQNYQIWRGNTYREGECLRDSHAPPQWGRAPALPILEVPFHLCTHHLTQNYQIWRGNTYGEGAF